MDPDNDDTEDNDNTEDDDANNEEEEEFEGLFIEAGGTNLCIVIV
ncbi:hypothetical protein [Clostridium sp.]|nr:hypothetical protein [Clostridium sp.]MDR3594281.1 hypothetical protein [Clostridium sp.]